MPPAEEKKALERAVKKSVGKISNKALAKAAKKVMANMTNPFAGRKTKDVRK